jgi:DNA helicase-2/ATP-dependent DNA helicase PcrA
MSVAYLEKLNDQQRLAVEHGVALPEGKVPGPLLIIAGAGSGKTNTLAHRVAHLIVNGADPRRILLMTFSRRAASEMARRVERICKQVLGANSGILTDALAWSGTFHGIGARLLRIYAEQIGLNVDFTIHDREDSADLMNLVRHELGFSKTESRFPTKGTCLSIYSRVVNSEAPLASVLKANYPWVSGWEAQLKELFAGYVEAKQAQNVLDYDDLLLYWAQMASDPDIADDVGGRFDHIGVVFFTGTDGELADAATVDEFYFPAARGEEYVWASWRPGTLEELVTTWPARTSPGRQELDRGWWLPTLDELRTARRNAQYRRRKATPNALAPAG